MTRPNRVRGIVLLVALAVALTGCGGGGGKQADAPGVPPGGGTSIVIKDFAFSPVPAQVRLGQSITVTNEDNSTHTLTVPGGIDSGHLAPGASFTFTPERAGTLDYLCDIHQYMKGRIVVAAS